jgi:hypothetical protein
MDETFLDATLKGVRGRGGMPGIRRIFHHPAGTLLLLAFTGRG